MLALHELPEIGGVAGGDHRDIRQDSACNGCNQPKVVAMDDVRRKFLGSMPNIFDKGLLVCKEFFFGQFAINGTPIRHDITHPGYGEVEIRTIEEDKSASIFVDAIENGDIAGRNTADQIIIISTGSAQPEHVLKEKAAAGGIGPLAQYMENFETCGKNHPN
jgi:hypothetical protein